MARSEDALKKCETDDSVKEILTIRQKNSWQRQRLRPPVPHNHMQRLVRLSIVFCLLYSSGFGQFSPGRLEAYTSAGLFTARFSHGASSTATIGIQGITSFGGIVSYGAEYGVPVSNKIQLKAGIGYAARQYSAIQSYYYRYMPLFILLIPSDPAQPADTFRISRLQFNNRYVEIPLSLDYNMSRHRAPVQVRFGLRARFQFLTSAKVATTPLYPDSAVNDPAAVHQAEQRFADDESRFVFTIEPYMDVSFRIYKSIGVSLRAKPASFYASNLGRKTIDSHVELLNVGLGAWYHF